MKMDHNWETLSVGNWFSEYKCTRCGKKDIEEPDEGYVKPVDGCTGIINEEENAKLPYV